MTKLEKIVTTTQNELLSMEALLKEKKSPTKKELIHFAKKFQQFDLDICSPKFKREHKELTGLNPLARSVNKAIQLLTTQATLSKGDEIKVLINALIVFKRDIENVIRVERPKIRRKTKGQEIR